MPGEVRGILLCGGASTRFGSNKLLAPVDPRTLEPLDGETAVPLVTVAARNLIAGAGRVVAVLRPGEQALAAALEKAGCEVLATDRALRGIGASIAAAVEATPDAAGWVIGLGDMPFIRRETIRAVAARIAEGAAIVAPLNAVTGERGHPVGFSRAFRDELLALDGDQGARSVITRHAHALTAIPVDDPGIFMDIDTPHDLRK